MPWEPSSAMHETTFHAGISRRLKTADGHRDFSINVSGIPVTAGDEFIRMAAERAEFALSIISEEIEQRIKTGASARRPAPRINPAALDHHPAVAASAPAVAEMAFDTRTISTPANIPTERPTPNAIQPNHPPTVTTITGEKRTLVAGEDYDPFDSRSPEVQARIKEYDEEQKRLREACESLAEQITVAPAQAITPAATETTQAAPAPVEIPRAEDVRMSGTVFGVEIPLPDPAWLLEPITQVNNDGNGGGQLKAVNTALGHAGYKGKDRHPAALAILQAYGELSMGTEVRDELTSISDLSKAEAHIVLSFLELAETDDLQALRIALDMRAKEAA